MSEWPLEVRVLAVCASLAAIAFVAAQGFLIAILASAILVLVYGLVG